MENEKNILDHVNTQTIFQNQNFTIYLEQSMLMRPSARDRPPAPRHHAGRTSDYCEHTTQRWISKTQKFENM